MYTVSTIIRFHDINYLEKLEAALQSLHAQIDCSVTPIIVCQRFTKEQIQEVQNAVQKHWYFRHHREAHVLNYENGLSNDARSELINEGMKSHIESGNRFLAFLDHDDLIYSHAYSLLATELTNTGTAFAFASVEVADSIYMNNFDFIYNTRMPFNGKNKVDLLHDNFCPIHSYLIDSSKIAKEDLAFKEDLTRTEDYEFLLRVAGKLPCSFSKLGTKIGTYIMRQDGSNSTPTMSNCVTNKNKKKEWLRNENLLKKYRSQAEVKFYASDF